MELDIIDEIKSLHNHTIRMLFCSETNKCIKPLQLAILTYLVENKDKVTYQKDLEKVFKISKAAISDVINNMVKSDLIVKEAEETDSRMKRINLTADAYSKYQEMLKVKQEINKSILENISASDLNKFLEVTNKLKENMKKEGK